MYMYMNLQLQKGNSPQILILQERQKLFRHFIFKFGFFKLFNSNCCHAYKNDGRCSLLTVNGVSIHLDLICAKK